MPKKSKKSEILSTAITLFSDKGYDATGMDEIAAGASVPKSLIYYHFENKEDLLNYILVDFFSEYGRILQDKTEVGIDKISRYIRFLEENKEKTRILLSESLKPAGNYHTAIFKAVEILVSNDPVLSEHPHWVTEFFTSMLPAALFVCYSEAWCQYFDVHPETLANDFSNAYKLTHGAYHEHIKKESL
ncbi:MAG: TetR/AcrR family transcriptional regulator [Lachnospiraceae bacterium]|jgi:AcrR family transcriptional regulator|nr:TetR/AcrR family transcriptional regulator [Lachnospiraceae bacterium]